MSVTTVPAPIFDEEFEGEVFESESLAKHTYYRIGGPADWLIIPASVRALSQVSVAVRGSQVNPVLLSLGSNVLVADQGVRNWVIKLNKFNNELRVLPPEEAGALLSASGRKTLGEPLVLVTGASLAISTLMRKSAEEGWSGLEFLVGVPGSVGGAVVMNAGTGVGEVESQLVRFEVFNLRTGLSRWVERSDAKFRYRSNDSILAGDVVTQAYWSVARGEPSVVKSRIQELLIKRKNSQPVEFRSCGSVFKNPKGSGISAWQVIEKIGLRGYRIGDAQISEMHTNFIVNLGAAKAADVLALIREVQSRAKSQLDLELEPEVKFLGF
jgi:UDP-N-acetylmuramate dehydrogenase